MVRVEFHSALLLHMIDSCYCVRSQVLGRGRVCVLPGGMRHNVFFSKYQKWQRAPHILLLLAVLIRGLLNGPGLTSASIFLGLYGAKYIRRNVYLAYEEFMLRGLRSSDTSQADSSGCVSSNRTEPSFISFAKFPV